MKKLFLFIFLIFIFLKNNDYVQSYKIAFDIKVDNLSYYNINDTISSTFFEASSKISTFYIKGKLYELTIFILIFDENKQEELIIDDEIFIIGQLARYKKIEIIPTNYQFEKLSNKVIIDGKNSNTFFLITASGIQKTILIENLQFVNWFHDIISLKYFRIGTIIINNCDFINSKFISIQRYYLMGYQLILNQTTFNNLLNNNGFSILFENVEINNCQFINNNSTSFIIEGKNQLIINNTQFNNNSKSNLILNNIVNININSLSINNNTISKPFIKILNNNQTLIESLNFNNNSIINNKIFLINNTIINNNNNQFVIKDCFVNNLNQSLSYGFLYNFNKYFYNNSIDIINFHSNSYFTNYIISTYNSTIEIINSKLSISNIEYSLFGYNNTITSNNNTYKLIQEFCNIVNNNIYTCKLAQNIGDGKDHKVEIVVLVLVPVSIVLLLCIIVLMAILIYQKKKNIKILGDSKIGSLPTFLNEQELSVIIKQ